MPNLPPTILVSNFFGDPPVGSLASLRTESNCQHWILTVTNCQLRINLGSYTPPVLLAIWGWQAEHFFLMANTSGPQSHLVCCQGNCHKSLVRQRDLQGRKFLSKAVQKWAKPAIQLEILLVKSSILTGWVWGNKYRDVVFHATDQSGREEQVFLHCLKLASANILATRNCAGTQRKTNSPNF